MEKPTVPESLTDVFQDSLRRLKHAATERDHPWRRFALASATADGRPHQRMVVLRGMTSAPLTLTVHTDARSAKVAELTANPAAAALFWDADSLIQLRLTGPIAPGAKNSDMHMLWDHVPNAARAQYLADPAPGTCISRPDAWQRMPDAHTHFTSLCLTVQRIDWLALWPDGHRRAGFTLSSDGALTAQSWLVP